MAEVEYAPASLADQRQSRGAAVVFIAGICTGAFVVLFGLKVSGLLLWPWVLIAEPLWLPVLSAGAILICGGRGHA